MLRKTGLTLAITAIASLGATGVASASTSFDPDSGVGFAGKGDVAQPLGLDNKALTAAVKNGAIAFSYADEATYQITCEREGRNETVQRSFNRTQTVSAAVVYDTRKNQRGNITGFNLTDLGNESVDGNLNCPTNQTLVGGPTLVSTSEDGGLSVTDGIGTAVIWTALGGSVL